MIGLVDCLSVRAVMLRCICTIDRTSYEDRGRGAVEVQPRGPRTNYRRALNLSLYRLDSKSAGARDLGSVRWGRLCG